MSDVTIRLLVGGLVRALADVLPISRPAVSRHLRLLKDAGLVSMQPQGTLRLYRLDEAGARAVRAYLGKVWGDAVGRPRPRGQDNGSFEGVTGTTANPASLGVNFSV